MASVSGTTATNSMNAQRMLKIIKCDDFIVMSVLRREREERGESERERGESDCELKCDHMMCLSTLDDIRGETCDAMCLRYTQ